MAYKQKVKANLSPQNLRVGSLDCISLVDYRYAQCVLQSLLIVFLCKLQLALLTFTKLIIDDIKGSKRKLKKARKGTLKETKRIFQR